MSRALPRRLEGLAWGRAAVGIRKVPSLAPAWLIAVVAGLFLAMGTSSLTGASNVEEAQDVGRDAPASDGGASKIATDGSGPEATPPTAAGSTNRFVATAEGRPATLDDRQKLAVGDRVTYRVIEDQEEAKLLTVMDAGTLDVPELGLVGAVGKTCKELAVEIKAKLERTTYYHATVIIGVDQLNRTPSGRKVFVVGQVRVTGPQDIPAGETLTVSRAIMKAGGFTDFADKKRVRLVRAGSKEVPGETFVINVAEILEKGKTVNDLGVEPEDLIYVPTRSVNFF